MTGAYPVGETSLLFTNLSRSNVVGTTNFLLGVSLFYPAQPPARSLPRPHADSRIAAQVNAVWSRWGSSARPEFHSQAVTDAPIASSPAPRPLIVYSHGGLLYRYDNTRLCEELASHGFIVAALDSRDTSALLLPDGAMIAPTQSGSTSFHGPREVEGRVLDASFLLDRLEELNQQDPIWSGRIDLDRVAALGFSAGGTAAAALPLRDPRFKVAVSLDGQILSALPTGLPLLVISPNTASTMIPVFQGEIVGIHYVRLAAAFHFTFSDAPFLSTTFIDTRGVRHGLLTASYVSSFLKKYLTGTVDGFLDLPPPSEVSEYRNPKP